MKYLTRRVLIAALACVLALALCGCGGDGEKPAAEAEPNGTAESHAAAEGGEPGSAEPSMVPTHTPTATPAPTPPPPTPAPTAKPTATPTPSPMETSKGLVKDGWVSGIPDYVPRFECGKLDLSQSKITEAAISTVFQLRFTGATKADVDVYYKALRDTGYRAAVAKIGETYTLTASKDFGWNSVSLVVTLTEHDGVAIYALDAPV